MLGGAEGAFRAQLGAGLERMCLALSADQRDRMLVFLALLLRWNRTYNLTAVRDVREMVTKHLLDSLSVYPHLFGERVLDLGTGPGLPGIPLAVAAPARVFYLLDSNSKKTRFVRQAAMDLGLRNVVVIHARMESYLPDKKFATIVSRAATSFSNLSTVAESLLARPGRLLTMKGRRPDANELRRLEPSPVNLKIHRLEVPFLVGERHLVEARYD